MSNVAQKKKYTPVPVEVYPALHIVHWTYGDYEKWELPEGVRYELIHGVAYQMAAPNDAHQALLLGLAVQIDPKLKGKPCKLRIAPYDVRLFFKPGDEEKKGDDTVVQPDLAILCGDEKRGEEGGHGAPNLVIEILSPSTRKYDLTTKLAIYLEAGVPECWMIDIEARKIMVYRLEKGKYNLTEYTYRQHIESTGVPGLVVDMMPPFARV
jgi:Uma2 family endonuclease